MDLMGKGVRFSHGPATVISDAFRLNPLASAAGKEDLEALEL